jgi:hypothetical protein
VSQYSITYKPVDPMQNIYDMNYAKNTGNALTNPRGFREQMIRNVNAPMGNNQGVQTDPYLVNTAYGNYKDPNAPKYEERKFRRVNLPDPADAPDMRQIAGTIRGRSFDPISLLADVRRNKLAMGQGIPGLLANKPKTGGLLSG